ncbi:MAG: TonB family protein [Bacteroidota bacterium]
MKRILILFSLFLTAHILIGQKYYTNSLYLIGRPEVKKVNAQFLRKIKKEGDQFEVCQYYKDTDVLFMQGMAEEIGAGKQKRLRKKGKWAYFNPLGVKVLELIYEEGETIDSAQIWHNDGKLAASGYFLPPPLEQSSPKYEANRFILMQAWNEEGVPLVIDGNGSMEWESTPYPSPTMFNSEEWMEGGIQAGQLNGLWTWTDEEGNVIQRQEFRQGIPDGIIEMYRDGRVHYKGLYSKGEPNGLWTFFDDEGEIIHQVNFRVLPLPDFNTFLDADQEATPLNLRELPASIIYPRELLEQGIQGRVIVRVLVSKTGKVLAAIPIHTPDPLLAKAVLKDINQLQFTPAKKDGQFVNTWINVPVNMKIQDD